MSRNPKMLWRKADEQKLTNAVRTFNAKITRELNKHPEKAQFLPRYKTKDEFKQDIQSRADYNRTLHQIERFKDKAATELVTNKYGLTVTRYQKKEIGIKLGVINRARSAERLRTGSMETNIAGKATGFKRAEMGNPRDDELKPKKYNFEKRKPSDWKAFVESVEKQAKASYTAEKWQMYKESYLKAYENNIGTHGAKEKLLYDAINSLDAKYFVDAYFSDETLDIDFLYDEFDRIAKLSALESAWEKIIENYVSDTY